MTPSTFGRHHSIRAVDEHFKNTFFAPSPFVEDLRDLADELIVRRAVQVDLAHDLRVDVDRIELLPVQLPADEGQVRLAEDDALPVRKIF